MVGKNVLLKLQQKINEYEKINHMDLTVICWIFWAVFLGTLLGNIVT